MHSQPYVLVGANHQGTGAPSLTQGAYGTRGNLELLSCDAHDGLWVYWLNADLPNDSSGAPDVPPGSWSGGLRFALGTKYLAAQIMQSTSGPDHLEVLALTDFGSVESWFWSPGPGFARRDILVWDSAVAQPADAFEAIIVDGDITCTIRDCLGALTTLVSGTARYPERSWEHAAEESLSSLAVELPAGFNPTAEAMPLPGTVRIATSTRDGGTQEVSWRGADGVARHASSSIGA